MSECQRCCSFKVITGIQSLEHHLHPCVILECRCLGFECVDGWVSKSIPVHQQQLSSRVLIGCESAQRPCEGKSASQSLQFHFDIRHPEVLNKYG